MVCFGIAEEGLVLFDGFCIFVAFWNPTGEGQHQKPSGVTAIGTFLILVCPCSTFGTLISAMSLKAALQTAFQIK